MSNPNLIPLGSRRRWPNNEEAGEPNTSSAPPPIGWDITGVPSSAPGQQLGVQGEILARATPLVTGACRKCGFIGHLPFQCRNFIQLKPNQKTDIDISSTSSEEYTTPLTEKNDKKAMKKEKKKQKKELKRLEKKLMKELRKNKGKKKKRSRSSSSSSSTSSEESSSLDEGRGRRHGKKLKREKTRRKKEHKKRSRRSSSSSSG